ncbi:AAA family ATPase [Chloroflexota bacterium]
MTVILGPNAVGKGNLLDALALLSRMVTRKTLNEAFDEHRGVTLGALYAASLG